MMELTKIEPKIKQWPLTIEHVISLHQRLDLRAFPCRCLPFLLLRTEQCLFTLFISRSLTLHVSRRSHVSRILLSHTSSKMDLFALDNQDRPSPFEVAILTFLLQSIYSCCCVIVPNSYYENKAFSFELASSFSSIVKKTMSVCSMIWFVNKAYVSMIYTQIYKETTTGRTLLSKPYDYSGFFFFAQLSRVLRLLSQRFCGFCMQP